VAPTFGRLSATLAPKHPAGRMSVDAGDKQFLLRDMYDEGEFECEDWDG
jgi:hypothetical protein